MHVWRYDTDKTGSGAARGRRYAGAIAAASTPEGGALAAFAALHLTRVLRKTPAPAAARRPC